MAALWRLTSLKYLELTWKDRSLPGLQEARLSQGEQSVLIWLLQGEHQVPVYLQDKCINFNSKVSF